MVKSGGNAWNETGPQMSRESKAGAPRESGWATALLPQCALFHKCELGDKPDRQGVFRGLTLPEFLEFTSIYSDSNLKLSNFLEQL